jgi:uncharacterized membrane protein YedE/YeeE
MAGLLFGLGLLLSGMSNPAKVLGFLDVTGQWDPSLMLVMGGAIAIGFFAFRRAERQTHSLLGEPMQLPDKSRLTPRLVLGSALFGIGWGLAGICPGPVWCWWAWGCRQVHFVSPCCWACGWRAR